MTLVVQFIGLLISGVTQIVTFLQNLPLIFSEALAILPNSLAGSLFACLGVVIAVRFLELLP